MRGEFPDCEAVACDLAEEILGAGKGFNQLPEDVAPLLPLAWCFKFGGACDGVTDRPIVQIGVIAETRSQALVLSNRIRDRVLEARGTAVNGVLIDATEEKNGLRLQAPPMVRQPMITAHYQLSFRRQ